MNLRQVEIRCNPFNCYLLFFSVCTFFCRCDVKAFAELPICDFMTSALDRVVGLSWAL